MEEKEMTVKEYLGQIDALDKRIDNLINEKSALWQSMLPGGISYHERVQTSAPEDAFSDWRIRIEAMEQTINQEIDKLVKLRLRITREINQLSDPRYIRILYLRYVRLESWDEIAEKMAFTRRHVTRVHGWALQEFEKMRRK